MARYTVSMPKIIWYYKEVEADDEESALDEAWQNAPNLCAQCSGWGRGYSVDDSDGWGDLDSLGEQFREQVELVEE